MILKKLIEFLDIYKKKDPAARTYFEILLCYPGVHSIILHKISNKIWKNYQHYHCTVFYFLSLDTI